MNESGAFRSRAGSRSGAAPRLVILDRDGVINADSDEYIKSPEEFRLLPGSAGAILRLKRAGMAVAIATNQSGLARGYFDETALEAMHAKLRRELELAAAAPALSEIPGGGRNWIDHIVYCPHGPDDACKCRKPLPGMLLDILKKCNIPARDAAFVGDSLTDIQAARAAGVRPILVRSGKGERSLARCEESEEARETLNGVSVHRDLAAVAGDLLAIAVDDPTSAT
ncbi:MAG: D-glycero-beta-D-manno-heptose 1,7-bisphosphate 7-phosphatase [Leptospirales bacterium]|jgi:D-glycero-D-manno-heptose 1,7-bisphosphate phosphatase